MKMKTYNFFVITGSVVILMILAAVTIIIDPYFHYHKPLKNLSYSLDNERYQNDGIVRHFEYDAIITGTSMAENFKVSELNKIFGVNAIKVPFSGGYFKEINDNLNRAYEGENKIEIVVRSLDRDYLLKDKDALNDIYTYPEYLYDNFLINDVSYVLNKSILVVSLATLKTYNQSVEEISFDEYEYWSEKFIYGKEAVLESYSREEVDNVQHRTMTSEEMITVRQNLKQNVIKIAEEHPETTFYIFFPPYSICYWDKINRMGELEYTISLEEIVIEELLPYDNIKLFSFSNKFEWTCNLDNYIDTNHYGGWVNSAILNYIYMGKYQLKKENYQSYLQQIKNFYGNYNYANLYS